LRLDHLARINSEFDRISPQQRILLFCHDPSALPALFHQESVRHKLEQIEQTIIGHLHSNLILQKSRWLAGMPSIAFMGHTTRRLTSALNQARHWKSFKVRLCPSLAGIELLKDGGYYTVELDPDGITPAKFTLHRILR
jgi:hypothetical protein